MMQQSLPRLHKMSSCSWCPLANQIASCTSVALHLANQLHVQHIHDSPQLPASMQGRQVKNLPMSRQLQAISCGAKPGLVSDAFQGSAILRLGMGRCQERIATAVPYTGTLTATGSGMLLTQLQDRVPWQRGMCFKCATYRYLKAAAGGEMLLTSDTGQMPGRLRGVSARPTTSLQLQLKGMLWWPHQQWRVNICSEVVLP